MSDSDDSVARAATVAAQSDRNGGTAATESPARVRSRSIVPIGTVVGRYVLGERIGAGGMGTVYRARDPKLDRDIAVKLVSATDIEAAQQYLEREAQAMAKLSHPNVCIVHDIGTWNAQLFIAMELCSGGSLASWLTEPRPWREVVLRFVEAGRGLAAAHRIGLVHRDFKPDNVLVNEGVVKVSDFGLVRSSAGAPSTDSNPDRIEGTPAYMAPEQLEGFEVDARADQFAFAVSVWEGVCGGRPFQPEGKDHVAGMLRAIRGRRFMRSTTSKVPSRVLALLERALAADPKDRWPSLDVLVDALERRARPSRKRFVVAAAAAAVLAAGATAIVMRTTRAPDIAATTRVIEREVGAIFRGAGEIITARDREKQLLSDAEYETALAAYTAAFNALGDKELRPRIARSMVMLQRCDDAVVQLDAYLNAGGQSATISDVDGYERRDDGTMSPLDRAYVASLKIRCDDENPRTEEARSDRAMRLWRDGDFDGAVRQLEQLIRTTGHHRYIKTIGDIWQSAGNCVEARKQYMRWISEDKTIPPEWVEHAKRAAENCQSN